MTTNEVAARQDYSELCAALIRDHRNEILACWEERVRILPVARKLGHTELVNHVPELLDRIASRLVKSSSHHVHQLEAETAEGHAIQRYEQKFDLAAVVTELGMLRSCILLTIDAVHPQIPVAALRILDEAIDAIVTYETEGYVGVRERTLQVFDQIATAALDSRSLDELVNRLLEILVHSSESVDMAALLVPHDDTMRVRSSIGEEQSPAWTHFSESVAHRVASSREEFELRDTGNARVRVLYAIPLIDAGEVTAVLHMGSLSADRFSLDEKRLLRAVGARATAAIRQHMLREAAERTTRDLRMREEEFHTLADNIPQFTWMADARGNIYWYNKRWLEYAGTTLEQMRALGPIPFIHPDHVPRVTESFQHAVAEARAWEETFPMRCVNGRYRWFLCRAIPIVGAHGTIARWFGTNTDVTEQRFLDEATKVLNSSLDYEETLQQIARLAVPDLADWCVVDLAEAPKKIRRVAIASSNPEGEKRTQEWDRTYPPIWDAETGVERAIRMGEPVLIPKVTEELMVADARSPEHLGELRALNLVSIIIAPLMARGRALGSVTLVTSESQRTYGRTELEVATELGRRAGTAVDNARLYKESQQALSERRAAVKSREEVLAIVSHDLRGPLNTIGMSTSLLEQRHPDPESSRRLQLIHNSADFMEHMIDDLLDVASIEAKGLVLRRELEDAERLVSAAVEAHETAAASHGIAIKGEGHLDSVRIRCDRERIERVFTNLIGNALKFCRRGDAITVEGHVAEGQVVFSVADTGPGIPPDQAPHLFDRYWTSTQSGTKGTGLGLYICKGIVEAHGGTLGVESSVGHGTKFSFTLPLSDDR